MLIPVALHPLIADGTVTVAVRRWTRPTVKAGGTLVTPVGVLAIDAVDVIDPSELSDDDARRAGAESAQDLLTSRYLQRDGDLHRIRFHLAGEDPRIALRAQDRLDDDELAEVLGRLLRYDRSSTHGPWTRTTLELIGERPAVRAGDLAESVGREMQPFKTDVRKLKALGLTESLEVGYRLSPRGVAVLAALREHPLEI